MQVNPELKLDIKIRHYLDLPTCSGPCRCRGLPIPYCRERRTSPKSRATHHLWDSHLAPEFQCPWSHRRSGKVYVMNSPSRQHMLQRSANNNCGSTSGSKPYLKNHSSDVYFTNDSTTTLNVAPTSVAIALIPFMSNFDPSRSPPLARK